MVGVGVGGARSWERETAGRRHNCKSDAQKSSDCTDHSLATARLKDKR